MRNEVKLITLPGQEFRVWYYTEDIPGWIRGTIADVETRGLKPKYDNLTALGLVKENRLSLFVIHHEDENLYQEQFKKWAKDKIKRCPVPFAAYYNDFESSWLGVKFQIELQPEAYQKKAQWKYHDYYGDTPPAIQINHISNSDNMDMLEADEHDIMEHLYWDLLEELALFFSKAHDYRYGKLVPPEVPIRQAGYPKDFDQLSNSDPINFGGDERFECSNCNRIFYEPDVWQVCKSNDCGFCDQCKFEEETPE